MADQIRIVGVFVIFLAVTLVGYGLAGAATDSPHSDYRPGGYQDTSCVSGTAACHDVSKGTFLPHAFNRVASTDYTEFCLSCHNTAGEAHERSAGSAAKLPYVNLTGLDKGMTYDGDSHSWNGVTGGAGTRVPTITAFGSPSTDPTNHMPNTNEVTCQVCHEGMYKIAGIQNIDWALTQTSDNLNYEILNGGSPYGSTAQHSAQYLRVYRSASLVSSPANSRSKKAYLVDPSEYTYDYSTGTITFLSAQTPTDYIYADIGQPYFRVDNNANTMCLDCHNDRQDISVNHPGDAAATDHHPVGVTYGFSGGLNDTLKGSADANIYIEGTTVLCTSCHDPHNAASKDGMITRSADSSELCTDCHKVNGYDGYTSALLGNHSTPAGIQYCTACHTTHGTDNILLIKNRINGKAVSFRNFTGANSFGNETGDSVCEACHTSTSYHLSDGSGTSHHKGEDCTECHKHSAGFMGGGCSSCHAFPPDDAGPWLASYGWNDTTGDAHPTHMSHLDTAAFGNLAGSDACAQCHGATIPRFDHNTSAVGKDNAGMDTATWTSWTGVGGNYGAAAFTIGSTIGKVSTSDDTCENVSCHSSGGIRIWGGGTDCNSCHSYPSPGSDWTGTNGHTVQYDGLTAHMADTGYDPTTDDYVAMTTDSSRCGKCHYNTFGSYSSHQNQAVDVKAYGNAACAPGPDFTINVNTSRSDVTCSNVKCHTANTNTPNWWD